jgi:hypothetical protein
MQLVPPLPLALLLLLPPTQLHPLPATQRSNHFVIHEKAASGRLFCACCYLAICGSTGLEPSPLSAPGLD